MNLRCVLSEFPNYVIYSDGRIKGTYGRFLKPILISTGYNHVGLCKEKKRYGRLLHRIVAKAFIPNPDNKPCINHKNGIKTDNRVENLEWVTYSENEQHSYKVLGKKSRFKV